jgi:hypothetical protein
VANSRRLPLEATDSTGARAGARRGQPRREPRAEQICAKPELFGHYQRAFDLKNTLS